MKLGAKGRCQNEQAIYAILDALEVTRGQVAHLLLEEHYQQSESRHTVTL